MSNNNVLKPICLGDFIKEVENLYEDSLSAPLVALDKDGVPRYVINWDIKTSGECVDDLGEDFEVVAARIVFVFGGVADV